MAVSPDGATLYVTGESLGKGDGTNGTVAYSAATGAVRWRDINTMGAGSALVVSPDGSTLYVSGAVDGPHGWEYSTSGYDAADGSSLWTTLWNRTGTSLGDQIKLSPDGATLYLSGWTGGDSNTVAAYHTPDGSLAWQQSWHSPGGQAAPLDLAVNPDGSTVFVTGAPVSGGYATLGYNAATGVQQWVRRYTPPGGAGIITGAVNPVTDQVFVTGTSRGRTGAQQFATVAYTVTG